LSRAHQELSASKRLTADVLALRAPDAGGSRSCPPAGRCLHGVRAGGRL